MFGAEYGERGGTTAAVHTRSAPRITREAHGAHHPAGVTSSDKSRRATQLDSSSPFNTVSTPSNATKPPAGRATVNTSLYIGSDKLDLSPQARIARSELLRDSVFPHWKDDAGGKDISSPEEMQRQDPLGTQIWKLYSKTKTSLPNQERMENLTWRMMAISIRRREQSQAM